jgi:hypothetical protein
MIAHLPLPLALAFACRAKAGWLLVVVTKSSAKLGSGLPHKRGSSKRFAATRRNLQIGALREIAKLPRMHRQTKKGTLGADLTSQIKKRPERARPASFFFAP